MMRLRCVVERITYQNSENGYTIIKTKVRGYRELVTVVGTFPDVSVGSVLLIDGEWKQDKKYGAQFIAVKWEETMPATAYGIERYLGSGLVKGIGPKFSKRIVAKFGTDTISVIEDTPERLLEIAGIGEKRVEKIKESWEKQKEVKNIMLFLQGYDVSTAFASKIYKTYGNDSIKIVKENPFRLADDIWGIGFKTADRIADKMGFDHNGMPRCRSGVAYALNELSSEGHVYGEREQLERKAVELLDADREAISSAIESLFEDKSLVKDGEVIYLPSFYAAEVETAKRLRTIFEAPSRRRGYHYVNFEELAAGTNINYDEVQRKAILEAAKAKIMILTGGPGTGKTTTTLGIISVLRRQGMKILLAAPTGRAAKRLSETTGMEAKTIHRLLEYKPPEGYGRNEKTPLEGDVLIVDESSMIDIVLMNSLLKAVPDHMKLILVGDVDQLPSVGAGNVLKDIIDSGCFPVVRLTKIFRQAQSSRIITNAHRINRGDYPDISNAKGTDFFFIEEEDADKAADEIVKLVKERLPKYCQTTPAGIQVLTPMQKGAVGAANLNKLIQEAVNPSDRYFQRGGREFRKNDKVMQIRNNYEKEVFNGDIGTVKTLDFEEHELIVDFDGRPVIYDVADLDELAQAYAVTVHKSQGSEYPVVVMPIMMTHFVMLQRNLLYTGITRAKKLMVVVGSKKALACAVRNVTVTKRNSNLAARLQNWKEL